MLLEISGAAWRGTGVNRRRLGFSEAQLSQLTRNDVVHGGDDLSEVGLNLWPTGGGQNENGKLSPSEVLLVAKGRPSRPGQTTPGVFEHGLDLLARHARKAREKIIHTSAIFEVFEQ